ncbi:glycoside hydrolase family protein, partial [Acinetobacter baumannii]
FGWGHLVNSGPCHSKIRGKSITREEAESLFAGDLANHENNVRKHVGIKLYQNEFDALVILDFNYPLGSKSTPKLLRA